MKFKVRKAVQEIYLVDHNKSVKDDELVIDLSNDELKLYNESYENFADAQKMLSKKAKAAASAKEQQ